MERKNKNLIELLDDVHKIQVNTEMIHQEYRAALSDLVDELQNKANFKEQILEKIHKKLAEIKQLQKSKQEEDEKKEESVIL